jgi:hypothetical protein
MEITDRRDRVALDKAYDFYRDLVTEGSTNDLHKLANSLKTVCAALEASEKGDMALTYRLWRKIKQALFDKLLTSFPCYVVAISADGEVLNTRRELPEDCSIELHPEGLRRDDDVFQMDFHQLHSLTQDRLSKVWLERGPSTRKEDFTHHPTDDQCVDGVCALRTNGFIVGDEVLSQEATEGRLKAYDHYWRLYWQSYCTPSAREKQYFMRQMASLEAVWGNLHY